jgi:predicted metal-dependent phosphoesterase TrpH
MGDFMQGLVTNYDLHTHSTASDGVYTPAELVARAASAGIKVLALTDHDTTAGLAEAEAAARETGIRLISGVEISTTWQHKTLHLVGLNIDAEHALLQAGLQQLDAIRTERASEMGRRLEKAGIPGILEAAEALAGKGMLTRTHFAHCIARLGLAVDVRDVFNRYLTAGKPGYVSTRWADLDTAITWIRAAGGVAVLAHPQRYQLTGSWLRRLLGEYREMGGAGLEVLSGTATPGDVQSSTALALRFNLLASCGSDFHGPDEVWPKLGRLPALPAGLNPVWHAFENSGTATRAAQ